MPYWSIEQRDDKVELAGNLSLRDAREIWRALRSITPTSSSRLTFDVSRARSIDGAIMALLAERRAELFAQGLRCDIDGATTTVQEVVSLFGADRAPTAAKAPRRETAIEQIGAAVMQLGRYLAAFLRFVGDIVAGLRRPRTINVRALPSLVSRAGADGIPTVVLLNFLVGFVIAFQSIAQLKTYGANIYIADVVGISLSRELAPLMTAIIMAGRSGASYAAELGTMRVSEEIDALRTLGFTPATYLVMPRIVTLAIIAPLLTLVADVVGIFGGMLVASSSLGVTPPAFMTELQSSLTPSDVWTGLLKSIAFGIGIALIGCHQGLTASGAASGVGRSTTATVVRCLFMIVVVDTLFTIVFRGVGV